MITNNSFLDGVTHRVMRHNLMSYFDDIYVLDLHGSAKKKEISSDGTADKNVFDIMQGVSICLMIKKDVESYGSGKVYHAELIGGREFKNESMWALSLKEKAFKEVSPLAPYYFFVPKNFDGQARYETFFSIQSLMPLSGSGVKTERDKVCIHFDANGAKEAVCDFMNGDIEYIRKKYSLKSDSRDWTINGAVSDVRKNNDSKYFKKIIYRPFDVRYTYYTGSTRGFMGTPGRRVGELFFNANLGLVLSRTVYGSSPWQDAQVTDTIVEFGIMATRVGNTAPVFPLYLYPEEGTLDQSIRVNFDPKLYASIRKAAGLTGPLSAPDGTDAFRRATGEARPDEVKVFDYIYGVLHCPAYRETYAEFLKIDFPRIPFPASPESFLTISEKGEALRRLHLMEDAAIGATPYPFDGEAPEGQDCMVEKARFEAGRVWINGKDTQGQYFDGVPAEAWNFHIGGYQPAQKWLKDRKGRALSWDDIRHYQKIIKILTETARIMGEIEMDPPACNPQG